MGNQFWAVGCGLGWTVKKMGWADYEQLLRPVFWAKKNIFFLKTPSVRTEKLDKIKVKKVCFFHVFVFFYRLKFEWNLRSGTKCPFRIFHR